MQIDAQLVHRADATQLGFYDVFGVDVVALLKQRQELRGIELQGSVLSRGAGTRHSEVARSDKVRSAIPALAALADRIGDPAVRNLGTIGGSVAHGDPASDMPAVLLACEGSVTIRGAACRVACAPRDDGARRGLSFAGGGDRREREQSEGENEAPNRACGTDTR